MTNVNDSLCLALRIHPYFSRVEFFTVDGFRCRLQTWPNAMAAGLVSFRLCVLYRAPNRTTPMVKFVHIPGLAVIYLPYRVDEFSWEKWAKMVFRLCQLWQALLKITRWLSFSLRTSFAAVWLSAELTEYCTRGPNPFLPVYRPSVTNERSLLWNLYVFPDWMRSTCHPKWTSCPWDSGRKCFSVSVCGKQCQKQQNILHFAVKTRPLWVSGKRNTFPGTSWIQQL